MSKVKPNTPEEIIELMQQASENSLYKITSLTSSHTFVSNTPAWNFGKFRYELVKEKPSIDWSHVSPKFKYMATDDYGETYLYTHKPTLCDGSWIVETADDNEVRDVSTHSSYKAGTCDWKDSLVERPYLETEETDILEGLIDILRKL